MSILVTSITAPATSYTTDDRPTVVWTVGATQGWYEVRVFSAAQYSIGGFNPETSPNTWTSGAVPSGTTSYAIPIDLANETTYRVYVRASEVAGAPNFSTTWPIYRQFTVQVYKSDITSVTPANGSTVTTSRPAVNGSTTPMGGNIPFRRIWQFSTSPSFTAPITVTEENYSVLPTGPVAFPSTARLAQGTWYLRARSQDVWGNYGNWSATNTITVLHAPSTGQHAPSGNDNVTYDGTVTLSWEFNDPDVNDYQSAYQVQLWTAADPAGTLIDTGYVPTAPVQVGESFSVEIPVSAAYLNTLLQWWVVVYDQDTISGDFSATQDFYARGAPAVVVTSPSGSVTTGTPAIQWTVDTSDGRTQVSYRVVITNTTLLTTVADSGTVTASGTRSWTPSTAVIKPGYAYQAAVTVTDSFGFTVTATTTFTASYTQIAATAFTVDDIDFDTNGSVIIDWTGASPNVNFRYWRIYRRLAGATTWKLVLEDDTVGTRSLLDYTAPSGPEVEYALVQAYYNATFDDVVESQFNIETFQAVNGNYMLVVPDNPALNVVINNVISDELEEEYEEETMNLLGRGRRHEIGGRRGFEGSLEAQIYGDSTYTARGKRIAIENIRASALPVYLRNPFGDVWLIALTSVSYSRIAGVGTEEYMSVTIDYTEVEAA